MEDSCLTAEVCRGGVVQRLASARPCRSLNDRARSRPWALGTGFICVYACVPARIRILLRTRSNMTGGNDRRCVLVGRLGQAEGTALAWTPVWTLRTCLSVKCVVLDKAFFFLMPSVASVCTCVCCVYVAPLLYGITLHLSTRKQFLRILTGTSFF